MTGRDHWLQVGGSGELRCGWYCGYCSEAQCSAEYPKGCLWCRDGIPTSSIGVALQSSVRRDNRSQCHLSLTDNDGLDGLTLHAHNYCLGLLYVNSRTWQQYFGKHRIMQEKGLIATFLASCLITRLKNNVVGKLFSPFPFTRWLITRFLVRFWIIRCWARFLSSWLLCCFFVIRFMAASRHMSDRLKVGALICLLF